MALQQVGGEMKGAIAGARLEEGNFTAGVTLVGWLYSWCKVEERALQLVRRWR